MDMVSDDTSSSSPAGGQNEMDVQPLDEPDSPIIIATTNAKDNLNPLNNNDTVLPKILSLLPLRDLKTARSVSRRWNQFSAKYFHAFNSAAQLCFCESRRVYSLWAPEDHIPHGIRDMEDFIHDVRTRGTCSFKHFDLGLYIMRKEGSSGTVSDFFSVCGPYIEELNVGKEYKQTQVLYEHVLVPSPLTSLRVLRVNICGSDAFLGDFFDFVGMIIQGATNLERVALRLDNLYEDLFESQVTNCLIPPLRLCNLYKLEVNLEVLAELTSEHFIALSGIQGLRLKNLDLKLRGNIEDPIPLKMTHFL